MSEQPMIICRCEEVTLEKITHTLEEFSCSARELKLRTRAGMGYCGGRTCRPFLEALVKDEVPLKHQPPIRPLSFGNLGGDQS